MELTQKEQKRVREVKARYTEVRADHPDRVRRNLPTHLPLREILDDFDFLLGLVLRQRPEAAPEPEEAAA